MTLVALFKSAVTLRRLLEEFSQTTLCIGESFLCLFF